MISVPRWMPGRVWTWRCACWLGVLPLLLVCWTLVWHGVPDKILDGDAALLEMAAQAAADGTQLTGPYSRNGLTHPGPLYFYLLAPLYALLDGRAFSLNLTVTLLNLTALIAAAAIVRTAIARHGGLWALLVLLLYSRQLGRAVYDIWNPFVTILPFLLSVLVFAVAANGAFRVFPLAIGVSSCVVQTHLGYAPAITALAASTLLLEFCPPLRRILGLRSAKSHHRLLTVGVSVLVFGILWALPIIEELGPGAGNLSNILRFFASAAPDVSWQQAWQTFVLVISAFPRNIVRPAPILSILETEMALTWMMGLALLHVLGLGIAWMGARKQRHTGVAALAVMSGLACVVMLVSIQRIVGGVMAYLVAWMTTAGVLCWLTMGAMASEFLASVVVTSSVMEAVPGNLPPPPSKGGGAPSPLGRVAEQPTSQGITYHETTTLASRPASRRLLRVRRLVGGLLAAAILIVSVQTSREMLNSITADIAQKNLRTVTPQLERMVSETVAFFDQRGIAAPIVRSLHNSLWPAMAGLGLQLQKRGLAAVIDHQYPAAYPPRYAPTGHEDGVLLITAPRNVAMLRHIPTLRAVTEGPTCVVFWQSFSDGLEGELPFELVPAVARTWQGFSKAEWNPAGESYRWASAPESSLEIPLMPHAAHRITVTLTVRPPVRSIEVLANGARLMTVRGPYEWGWREIEIDVPARIAKPLSTIAFRYSYESDSRDGEGMGDRNRAIAFEHLMIRVVAQ